MRINEDISRLVYGDSIIDKSIKHKQAKDSTEVVLKHIKIFNNLKTVIANCTNKKKVVDLELLYTLVREMRYKLKIGMRNLRKDIEIDSN